MSLFCGSLRYIAITAKHRQNYCSSQLVLQLSTSSVSSLISTPFLPSSSSSSAQHFSSSSLNDFNSEDDVGGSGSGIISVRSQFKDIPVDSSIIQYIKRIGVGRSVRRDNKRKKKRPFEKNKKNNINTDNNNNDNTLSRDEEQYYLEGQEVKHRRRQSSQSQSQSYLPSNNLPPPFGDPRCETITRQRQRRGSSNVKANSTTTTSDDDDDDEMTISRSIQVLPVKLLGRMTTTPSKNDNENNNDDDDDDEYDTKNVFPRPTSGLPEVAIVGRSNVGKSTLLNALLYGGRTMKKKENDKEGEGEDMDNNNSMNRRNRRRRTAQTSKLPRGVKAKTSSKPGETRSIDFYQLSVQIIDEEKSSNDDDDNDYYGKNEHDKNNSSVNNRSKKKKKMSLLLVDFPGYGFARGPKKERNKNVDINGFDNDDDDESSSDEMKFLFPWQSLIETYITDRPRSSLKRVLLLIDARHGMKQADVNIMVSLQNALMLRQKQHRNNRLVGDNNNNNSPTTSSSTTRLSPKVPTELPPLQIVLTKCDLVSQSDLARRVIQVRQQLSDCLIRQPKILPEMLVSAQMEGQLGVLELQKELASLCGDGWR